MAFTRVILAERTGAFNNGRPGFDSPSLPLYNKGARAAQGPKIEMAKKIKDLRTATLINPRAANSRWTRRKLLRAYLQKKLPGDIYDGLGDMKTTLEKVAVACRDSDVIVAMGGDGTVADTLQGIFDAGRQNDVLFGVIPFGSGNAFRKSFDIPKNPLRAIDCLAEGVARPIDLMEVEGRVAAFASIGATARVTGEKLRGKIHGLWGHVLAGRRLFDTPVARRRSSSPTASTGRGLSRGRRSRRVSSTASSPRRTTSATAGTSPPRRSSTTATSTSPCSRSGPSNTPSSFR